MTISEIRAIVDPEYDGRSEEDKAALSTGALSWPDRKMQRWGMPCHWRDAGPFDWTGCDEVEVVPGKLCGVPILRKTRFAADNLLQLVEWGESPEDVADQFDLDLHQVKSVLRFADFRKHRSATAA